MGIWEHVNEYVITGFWYAGKWQLIIYMWYLTYGHVDKWQMTSGQIEKWQMICGEMKNEIWQVENGKW